VNVISAQLNYTIGDFVGNTDKILEVIRTKGNEADLIVFSELCVTGYYPKDLLNRKGFIAAQNQAIKVIIKASRNIKSGLVIGVVEENIGRGRPYFNSLLLIDNGAIVGTYRKQLLPTYGVFNEARHFESGKTPSIIEWRGLYLGFLICEDAWESKEQPLYDRDPVESLAMGSPDFVICINASPYNITKLKTRHEIIKMTAQACKAPVVYVNQVGGIDDLVFDGGSLAYSSEGNCIFEAPQYEESVNSIQLNSKNTIEPNISNEISEIAKQLTVGLRDYCAKSGFTKVVIGSSGGIDSAVTLAIAEQALGAKNVVAVTMPSKYSSAGSVGDSEALCTALGITLINSPIKGTFDQEITTYTESFGVPPSPLAQENLQARIRGQRLMTYSNSSGAMVVSTGNKTEMSVGYCTLYGDMAGGVSLLADLYKLQVYSLAKYLNESVYKTNAIPLAIIEKEPSAELAPDQVDSDALPPYDQLDAYLKILLEGDLLSKEEFSVTLETAQKMSKEDRVRIKKMLDRNEYKRRQAAPVIRVNRRSFGTDRQIPLTIKYTQLAENI
jgi:NAD+ synthetase